MQTPVRAARLPGHDTLWTRTLDRLLVATPRPADDRRPAPGWPANDDRLPPRLTDRRAPERLAG